MPSLALAAAEKYRAFHGQEPVAYPPVRQGFWKRSVRMSTALWLGLSRALYVRAGLVFRVLWIPAGVTVLYVGCIAVNYIRSALEKRRVTATFKRCVAPEIVNEVLKEGSAALELGASFVDVRGFTTMSERLPPRQVVEILNHCLTLIAGCILRNGGTLDRFVADAGLLGAPLPRELMERFGQTVSFGVGVHVGGRRGGQPRLSSSGWTAPPSAAR